MTAVTPIHEQAMHHTVTHRQLRALESDELAQGTTQCSGEKAVFEPREYVSQSLLQDGLSVVAAPHGGLAG
jgi:hypothetical protein